MCNNVCPWQAFPLWSNVRGHGQEPNLKWSTLKALRLGKLLPYPQTLDQAGNACQGQIFSKICKLQL